jgi:hypothetical protein
MPDGYSPYSYTVLTNQFSIILLPFVSITQIIFPSGFSIKVLLSVWIPHFYEEKKVGYFSTPLLNQESEVYWLGKWEDKSMRL